MFAGSGAVDLSSKTENRSIDEYPVLALLLASPVSKSWNPCGILRLRYVQTSFVFAAPRDRFINLHGKGCGSGL